MKTLFENWRKFVNEEESKPEEIEKKINSKLDAEGGAAGLEPLVKAAQEIDPDATEEDVKQMLDGMSNVEQHEKGDYIDAKDLSEVVSTFLEMKEELLDEKKKKAKKRDACYHKVKAGAKVWPSAYASGRLVQCRKVGAANYGKGKKKTKKESIELQEGKRIPRKKGQPAKSKKHSDLYTDEDPKGTIHGLGFKDEATARASVTKIRNSSRSHAHKIQAAVAMEQRAKAAGKSGPASIYRKYINSKKKKKNESLSLEDIVMEEIANVLDERCQKGYKTHKTRKTKKMFGKTYRNCVKAEAIEEDDSNLLEIEEELEENLRDWFGKSSGKTKSGKRVAGWVQVGGKYDGAPCAKQPGQKTKPKCVSSAKRRSMSKKERDSAARRKRKKDPNPDRRGKPKNVSTDPQKKRKSKKRKNK